MTENLSKTINNNSDKNDNVPTIGILGHSIANLCSRWAAPLLERGINVEIITPHKNLNAQKALAHLDGLLLPGGHSNIHPDFIGNDKHRDGEVYDMDRDFSALNLARHAFSKNIPTLGICRGMQEMITAHGGRIDKLEGEHHAKGYQHDGNHELMDGAAHPIFFQDDGNLKKLFNDIIQDVETVMVNSIHYEGITLDEWESVHSNRLRDKFIIEALADDNVIEAVSSPSHPFYVGVQAHFEFNFAGRRRMHDALFNAFEDNIKSYHAARDESISYNLPPESGLEQPVV